MHVQMRPGSVIDDLAEAEPGYLAKQNKELRRLLVECRKELYEVQYSAYGWPSSSVFHCFGPTSYALLVECRKELYEVQYSPCEWRYLICSILFSVCSILISQSRTYLAHHELESITLIILLSSAKFACPALWGNMSL